MPVRALRRARSAASNAASEGVGRGRRPAAGGRRLAAGGAFFATVFGRFRARRGIEVELDLLVALLQSGVVQARLLRVEWIERLGAAVRLLERDAGDGVTPLLSVARRSDRRRRARFGFLTALPARGDDVLARDAAAAL